MVVWVLGLKKKWVLAQNPYRFCSAICIATIFICNNVSAYLIFYEKTVGDRASKPWSAPYKSRSSFLKKKKLFSSVSYGDTILWKLPLSLSFWVIAPQKSQKSTFGSLKQRDNIFFCNFLLFRWFYWLISSVLTYKIIFFKNLITRFYMFLFNK